MAWFSRTAHGPFGKYDSKIDSFKCYEDTKRILRERAAHAPGGPIDVSEYIRRLLLAHCYGVDAMAKLHRSQYEAVRTKSEESEERLAAE